MASLCFIIPFLLSFFWFTLFLLRSSSYLELIWLRLNHTLSLDFAIYFWMLDVNRMASYEITRPSARPSVTKFSQDWIISFFYCTWWWLTIISSDWWSQILKKKKNWQAEFGPNGPKSGPKLGVFSFSQIWSISFCWNWNCIQW